MNILDAVTCLLTAQTTTPEIPINVVPDKEVESFWNTFKGLSFEDVLSKMTHGIVSFAFKLALAILVFYLGRFIIRKIYKTVLRIMTARHVDPSLTTFVLSLIKMTLYFILVISIIGILGLETSSFIAIFASAGVAMGMALSGTLQNFAGGVLILLLKPYKVGDFIEVQGYQGTVKSIQLFNTVINTIDNKAIIIPNGVLSTSSVNNYSLESYRRVDWTICLAYGTDLEKAKEAMLEIVLSDERVVRKYVEDDVKYREEQAHLKELEKHPELAAAVNSDNSKQSIWTKIMHRRAKRKIEQIVTQKMDSNDMDIAIPIKVERPPFVGLQAMADSSINFVVRAWTHSSNYWPLYFSLNERFYTELPQKGFSFPFPQMDVHLDHIAQ